MTITVIIPYTGNKMGLSQLLVSLQPQLTASDDIYVLDLSVGKSAKEVVMLYGSTRCYILVEPTNKPREQALAYGMEYMRQNSHEGALIIDDNVVISTTLIANIKKAAKLDFNIIFPDYSIVTDRMDSNFKWFGSPMSDTEPITDLYDPIKDSCVYVKNDVLGDLKPVRLLNELVVILPEQK